MKNLNTLILFIYILLFFSCQSNDSHKILTEMIGQEISFPTEMKFNIQDTIIDTKLMYSDYAIITYIDSTGCTPCKMKLSLWDETISELQSCYDTDISLIMILNTPDTRDVNYILKRDNFNHIVCIDFDNIFFKKNKLPKNEDYHTFIIDSNNKIIGVGNPSTNPKILEFYKQILEQKGVSFNITDNNVCHKSSRSLGIIHKGESVDIEYNIVNIDTFPYTIQKIIPSCDCTKITSSINVIAPLSNRCITVKYTGDSINGFFKQHIDVFFKEKNEPIKLTFYGLNK